MRDKVPLKFLLLAVVVIAAVLGILILILTLLPVNYTPTVIASLILLAFLSGGVSFNLYQERSNKKRRERGMKQARRNIGLEEESEDLRYIRRRERADTRR